MAKKPASGSGPELLKAALRQKQLDRLYIFCGDEVFLLRYYLVQMQKLLVDPLTEAFNYHKLTPENFTLRALSDAIVYPPMMAEHTMTVVDEIDLFKLPEGDRGELCGILADIPAYCTVVFTYETTPYKPDKRQKKLWEVLESRATVVEFARQDRNALIDWTTRHFAAEKKRISRELSGYLVDITGGYMTALAGEIAKICAYSGAEEICKSDIDAVTEPVLDVAVFEMTDLLGEGAYGAALKKLEQLLKMQSEQRGQDRCIAILGAIGAHIRRLGTARTLLDNGKGPSELMRLRGMSEYPAKKVMRSAGKFSAAFCARASELALETDYQMKTSFDEPERLLELLLLRLSQEARDG